MDCLNSRPRHLEGRHQNSRTPELCRCSISARNGRVSKLAEFTKRSEEHTSELQSLRHLVCRLLLEKKKKKKNKNKQKTNKKKLKQNKTNKQKKPCQNKKRRKQQHQNSENERQHNNTLSPERPPRMT